MAEPTDRSIRLGYAEPSTAPEPTVIADPAVAVLAAIQTLLAAVVAVVSVVAILSPAPSQRSEPGWVGAAWLCWWATYGLGSVTAIIGSCRPTPAGRRPFYRAYWFGQSVATAAVTAATVAGARHHYPELYWQPFVLTGILSPAWLLLGVRAARRLGS